MSAGFQTVHVRVNDAATGKPTPVRIRFVGADGTYYAPFGRLTEFATGIGEDVGGNVLLGDKKYAYIDGTCEICLPVGQVEVEIHKGPEYLPVQERIELKQGKLSLRLEIRRWIDLRSQGWYSGDTHCLYLAPQAALLEAQAEDLAVVNLLAAPEWVGKYPNRKVRALSNILAFSGQRAALQTADCLVAVNTLNGHQHFGELALLNCHRVIYPLVVGSPAEVDEWNLIDLCQQCHRKGGLVIATNFFAQERLLRGEYLEDIVLGQIDAIDFYHPVWEGFTHHYLWGLWYLLLQAGANTPCTGGSHKRSNQSRLGSLRTYCYLPTDEPLTYRAWIEAVRAGRTFATNGPIVQFTVNGQPPGARLEIATKETVLVQAVVQGLQAPNYVEVTFNGETIAQSSCQRDGEIQKARIESEFCCPGPGWFCARCIPFDPANDHGADPSATGVSHTSPIFVTVPGAPAHTDRAAIQSLLHRIDEHVTRMHRFARFETDQQRQRMANVYLQAKQRLQEKLKDTGSGVG